MNSLQIFDNKDFGSVRTIFENNKVLFSGVDVAKTLKHSNPRKALIDHCKGVTKCDALTKGGKQQTSFIPEGDVYRLIIRSKLPEAEKFEKWLFDEVLPSIHETGAYMTDETLDKATADPDFLGRLVVKLKDRAEQLEKEIADNEPRVLLAKAIEEQDDSISVKEMSKILCQNGVDIGGNRLYSWLRSNKYLCRKEGVDYNDPMQPYVNMGLFRIVKYTISSDSGRKFVQKIVRVTPKGQKYFVKKFLKLQREFADIA